MFSRSFTILFNLIKYNFDIFLSHRDLDIANNTRFYIFLGEKPFMKYIYTPKMDIYQLVYEFGGIMALWFGLSAYSICMKSILLIHQMMFFRSKLT